MALSRIQVGKGRRDRWGHSADSPSRKWYKRQMARLMRRLFNRNGEDAPKKGPYRGWDD